MAKPSINIQDGFLFQHLKESTRVRLELMSGRRIEGILKRFDRFVVVVDREGQEILVYKHAIATIEVVGDG